MKEWLVDVPVLLEFFCRERPFSQVFEQVKKARPRVLLLYQDGPRAGREDDIEGIKKCREIAESIDWDCEVHRNYQEKNVGCDPSGYNAQRWAFSIVDKCIVLEDDVVPSQSFFKYCKELLDYYENDERIGLICGMNNNEVSEDVKESYLFTQKGSIWGWASWRRVVDTWDGNYSWLDDPEKLQVIKSQMSKSDYESFLKRAREHRATGREYHETINAAANRLGHRLNIVPKYNMITNIGVDEESTHSVNDIRLLPRKSRRLLYMKRYEIDFPLVHPSTVVRNIAFEKKMTFSKIDKILMRVEGLYLLIKYRGIREAIKKIKKKMH